MKPLFAHTKMSRMSLIGMALALCAAYMLFPAYYEANIMALKPGDAWHSLDPSWIVGLNYIKLNGATWGTDIAFTYGPLAQLCTRVGWGEGKYLFLLFDLFVAINYFLIIFLTFKNSLNKTLTALLSIVVWVVIPYWVGAANALVLMIFLVFWIRKSLDRPHWFYYLIQIIIIVLLFFVKFNTGLIAFPMFYAGIICNLLARRGRVLFFSGLGLMPIILVILLAPLLKVSLPEYIRTGIEMVKGYNDVMYLENYTESSFNFFIATALLLLGVMIWNIYPKTRGELIRSATIIFLFSTSLFVLYKQAFVRADTGHISEFFIFVPLVMFCNFDLHSGKLNIYQKLLLTFAVLVPCYFLFVKLDRQIDLKSRFSKADYIKRFSEFTPISGLYLFEQSTSGLPGALLARVGTQKVDVYPWNIQLLLENKLKYHNRPVIQSYTAYTPYLESLNFQHYNSINAPQFVIYEFLSIDNRYPLFDESKVNLALSLNYEVAGNYDFQGRTMLLLQKKRNFKPVKLTKIREYAMLSDAPLVPKPGIFYEIGVYNSFAGTIKSMATHAPEIELIIQTKDGSRHNYKTAKGLLGSGVFLDKFFVDTNAFASYLADDSQGIPVHYYTFKSVDPECFSDKIRITEYKISQ